MNNIIATGTVGQAKVEDGKLILNVITHRSYTKNGAVKHTAAVLRTVYKYKENDEVAQLEIGKGSRVGIKGYIVGDFKGNGSANGPHVKDDKCAYEVEATFLTIVGPKLEEDQTYKDFEDVSEITLWGYLGKDAILRYTKEDPAQAVASASLAFSLTKYEESETKKYTVWFNIALFGASAERIFKDKDNNPRNLWRKGKAIIVQGSFLADPSTGGPNTWKKQDGSLTASYEINVASWNFAPGKRDDANGPDVDRLAQSAVAALDEEIPF